MSTKRETTKWMANDSNNAGGIASGTGAEAFKTLRWRITDALLTASATSQTLNADGVGPSSADFPANGIMMQTSTYIHALGDNAGSTAASLTIDVGTAANPDLYVDALDCLVGSGTLGFARQAGDVTPPTYPAIQASGIDLQIVVTSDVNVDTLLYLDVEIIVDYFLKTDPYA